MSPRNDRRRVNRWRRPKFYLDESAPVWIADILGHRYSIETAEQAGLLGRSDADHFAHCWRQERVLITHDYDFWDYKNPEVPDTRNPGVIVFACDNGNTEGIAQILRLFSPLVNIVGGKGWRDTRIVIGPHGGVRVRRRRASSGKYEISQYRLNASGVFEPYTTDVRKAKPGNQGRRQASRVPTKT